MSLRGRLADRVLRIHYRWHSATAWRVDWARSLRSWASVTESTGPGEAPS